MNSNAVYDLSRWQSDGSFSASPGQEVSHDVYQQMIECLPPLSLPRLTETKGFEAGFLLGEPYDHVNGRAVYAAFGRRDGRCFFLGYLPANKN